MNSEAYDLKEEKEKELFLKQLDVLLDSHQLPTRMLTKDIHIYKEDEYTILEWETVPAERDWGGKFIFLNEDEFVMKEVKFPDGHCEYVFPDEVEEKIKAWHKKNPGWTITSYGTWVNEEENRKALISACAEEWKQKNTNCNIDNIKDVAVAVGCAETKILQKTKYIVMSKDLACCLKAYECDPVDAFTVKLKNIMIGDPSNSENYNIAVYATAYLDDDAIYFMNDDNLLIYKLGCTQQ